MEKSAQEILDEIPQKKIKILKKFDKKQEIIEKNQIKQIIFEERAKNPGLTPYEVSNKYAIDTDTAEKYLLEYVEESKKKDIPIPSKPIQKNKKDNKFKKFFSKIFDKDDKETIEGIIAKVILYGIPLNFIVWCLLNLRFNLYSWIGWGLLVWFIDKKLVNIIRGCWIK